MQILQTHPALVTSRQFCDSSLASSARENAIQLFMIALEGVDGGG
jgi:hypothetical protein